MLTDLILLGHCGDERHWGEKLGEEPALYAGKRGCLPCLELWVVSYRGRQ